MKKRESLLILQIKRLDVPSTILAKVNIFEAHLKNRRFKLYLVQLLLNKNDRFLVWLALSEECDLSRQISKKARARYITNLYWLELLEVVVHLKRRHFELNLLHSSYLIETTDFIFTFARLLNFSVVSLLHQKS